MAEIKWITMGKGYFGRKWKRKKEGLVYFHNDLQWSPHSPTIFGLENVLLYVSLKFNTFSHNCFRYLKESSARWNTVKEYLNETSNSPSGVKSEFLLPNRKITGSVIRQTRGWLLSLPPTGSVTGKLSIILELCLACLLISNFPGLLWRSSRYESHVLRHRIDYMVIGICLHQMMLCKMKVFSLPAELYLTWRTNWVLIVPGRTPNAKKSSWNCPI